MLHQAVFNTSEICHSLGVMHAVLSPGSRNAPLIISFARNKKIRKHIIPDERSAGFIALGIAQKLNQPVVLCCTSGTALLNYAPAIAEAFYREIPLIVLSADRPPELIDQRDGQTIRQFKALNNHVKQSVQLPVITNDERGNEYQEKIAQAIQEALQLPAGPVHVNIPFKEPFYPTADQAFSFDYVRNLAREQPEAKQAPSLPNLNFVDKKVLILVGQQGKNQELSKVLEKLRLIVPIVRSPLNNLDITGIEHIDLFLDNQQELVPDILITAGLSVLSKKLKTLLKAHSIQEHYHFDPAKVEVDTYDSSPKLVPSSLTSFLSNNSLEEVDIAYVKLWKKLSDQSKSAIRHSTAKLPFSECKAFYLVSKSLPTEIDLHLSNSMPVRFADIFGVHSSIETWCNRGTSGIDGSTSTSVGTSLVSKKLSLLLSGDLSLLYDRNAFFHNSDLKNFRIVVFNNMGGGIFRLIEGPKRLPELEDYFETRHNRTAEYLCHENEIEYFTATSEVEIETVLESFYKPSGKAKLLEVFTVPEINEDAFKKLKQHVHEQIKF